MSHWDVPLEAPRAPESEQHYGLQGNPLGSAWGKIDQSINRLIIPMAAISELQGSQQT